MGIALWSDHISYKYSAIFHIIEVENIHNRSLSLSEHSASLYTVAYFDPVLMDLAQVLRSKVNISPQAFHLVGRIPVLSW